MDTPSTRTAGEPERTAVQVCEGCRGPLAPAGRKNLKKRHCSDRCRWRARRERERQAVRRLYAALSELESVFSYLRDDRDA